MDKEKSEQKTRLDILRGQSLEPRLVFDGAALAEFTDTLDAADTPDEANISEHENAPTPDVNFSNGHEIIFVDSNVNDYQSLINNINSDAQVFIIDNSAEGISQINNILNQQSHLISSIHIISHGDTGQIQLGNSTIDNNNILNFASQLQEWQNHLTTDADILLYGCNVGDSQAGLNFIETFADLTKADIAASDDISANEQIHNNADWILEVNTGDIEAQNILDHNNNNYQYSLVINEALTDGIQVNQFTANDNQNADITTLSTGNIIIVWESDANDGSGYGVFGRVFDDQGNALTDEFQINEVTANDQEIAKVTALNNGGFVVTWEDFSVNAANDIMARIYDANFDPVGGEFQVNNTPGTLQRIPTITTLENGNFVIAWRNVNAGDSDEDAVYAKIYDPDGNIVKADFLVNTSEENDQGQPFVQSLQDGGFIVAYHSDHAVKGNVNIYAQRFDADGNKVGSELLISETTASNQNFPIITQLDNGNIAFTWQDDGAVDGSGHAILYRIFDSTFTNPVTSELIANTTTSSSQFLPSIQALDSGGFHVTWWAVAGDGSDRAVMSQQFDADGNKVGVEYVVNDNTVGRQKVAAGFSTSTVLDDGRVAVWYEDENSNNHDIFIRFFALQVNLAPEMANLSLTGPNIIEDNPSTAQDVSSLITSATTTDAEGASLGMAVTSLTGNGNWQFSNDGGTSWSNIGSVSNANALLLDHNAKVRFVPADNDDGNASLQFRAWDQSDGNSSGDTADVSTNGTTAAYSSQTATLSMDITPVNDAPDFVTNNNIQMTDIINGTESSGQLVSSLLNGNFIDVDGESFAGIALVGSTADASKGQWQISTDGGASWNDVGTISNGNATIIAPTTLIRFSPSSSFSGDVSLSIRNWDGTAEAIGSNKDISAQIGSSGAFSQNTKSLNITVIAQDSPVFEEPQEPTLPPTKETNGENVKTIKEIVNEKTTKQRLGLDIAKGLQPTSPIQKAIHQIENTTSRLAHHNFVINFTAGLNNNSIFFNENIDKANTDYDNSYGNNDIENNDRDTHEIKQLEEDERDKKKKLEPGSASFSDQLKINKNASDAASRQLQTNINDQQRIRPKPNQ